jgi:four helix bundle protein
MKLKGPLRDQLIRASSSIALNLREGAAQPTVKNKIRFYFISLGSLREVQAIIDLKKLDQLKGPADKLGAHLYKLCHQKLELKNS